MGCCAGNKRSEGPHKLIENEKVDTEQSQPAKMNEKVSLRGEMEDKERPQKNLTNKEKCRTIKISPALFIQFKGQKVETEYEIGKKLGEGHYGYVRLAINKQTGHKRAIKSIEKSIFPKTFLDFKQEFELLKSLDHPNIVKAYECFEDTTYIHIVTEYIPGGQLIDYIVQQQKVSESSSSEIMKQIFSGIGFCHSNNIVHGDLQPENLLLENGSSGAIKIIDFVSSSLLGTQNSGNNRKNSSFSAPEVIRNQLFDSSCDLWSCGVIMYLLLSGKLPFYGKNENDIRNRVVQGEYSLKIPGLLTVSEEARDLIRKLLQIDPKKRISAEDALAHPWFQKAESNKKIDLSCLKNLSNFRFGQKFQQAISMFISSNLLSKEAMNKMNAEFRVLDTNGDGKISKDELLSAYKKTMTADKARLEVDKIMSNIDSNESGFIDYSEFISACMKADEVLNEENLRMAFKIFDKDGSGKLKVEEVKELLGASVGDEEAITILLKEIDSDEDGEIDIKEFENVMFRHFRDVR